MNCQCSPLRHRLYVMAKALAVYIGEPVAKLKGTPPLITKAELNVLRRKGRPNGMKIRKTLGWKTTPLEDGMKATIKSLKSLTSNS